MRYRFYTDSNKQMFVDFTEEAYNSLEDANLEITKGEDVEKYKAKKFIVNGLTVPFGIVAPIKDFEKIEE